eukprot:CAMPEP_0174904844 /NCGR_PEP_ID=MMETSP0167-20121228/50398_1 /TAXON_ID=38298 /ORGANISM="Rhodella maculata, Strain CCMP736" /LENGTH=95 /DNA_ID=CAMNT_0016147611 /DNA_START=60 /DNA_END=344 /DNA_ORIENTATION=-
MAHLTPEHRRGWIGATSSGAWSHSPTRAYLSREGNVMRQPTLAGFQPRSGPREPPPKKYRKKIPRAVRFQGVPHPTSCKRLLPKLTNSSTHPRRT